MNELRLGDPIHDFLMESDDNIRLASKVAKAWPMVRSAIAAQFIQRVKGVLCVKGGQRWRLDGDGIDVFEKNYSQPLWLTKPSWSVDSTRNDEPMFFVSLEVQLRGKRTVVGVWRERDKIGEADSILVDAFRKAGMTARPNQWWVLQDDLPDEVNCWRDGDVLSQIKSPTSKWVDAIADSIFRIASIAEPVLDRFCAKKR